MATLFNYEYTLVYINADVSIVPLFYAEWDAPTFADFGDYLIPYEWVHYYE